jgi:hypothetical protein
VQDFPASLKAIVALGIHHYRNGIDPYAGLLRVSERGETRGGRHKSKLADRCSLQPGRYQCYLQNAPNSIESFEGLNEDDVDAGPVATFTQMLRAAVRRSAYGEGPDLCASHVMSPGTPIVSTETGFTSGTRSDEALARYITRTDLTLQVRG